MSQNYDLIEDISGGPPTGPCNCSEADLAQYFISKNNGSFIGTLGTTESGWSPYNFTLGTNTSFTKSTLAVRGNNDANAEILVGTAFSQTSIKPNETESPRFRTNSGNIDIQDSGCVITGLTFNGNILPATNNEWSIGSTSVRIKKMWTVDIDVSGAMDIPTLSANTLNISGASTFGGNATFNSNITAASGSVTALNLVANNNIQANSGTITTFGSTTGTFATLNCTSAPTSNNHVVRRIDARIASAPSGTTLAKIGVSAAGFITTVQQATASDLPTHAGRHHTTSLTSATPASGQGGDGLSSFQIGAVDRASPVVKLPLRISNGDNYTYNSSAPYFLVIQTGQTPDPTGPAGQIIFAKAPL